MTVCKSLQSACDLYILDLTLWGKALLEQVIVVDGMMVANITKLSMIRADKFEHNPIGSIYSEAPYFMVLGVQFFGSERRMEGVAFEQFRPFGCLALNESG